MENRVSTHNLKKNFGKLEVLKDISIEIRGGEVICMIGPPGSGKSTFLRCLDRLEEITSDHVAADGYPISDPNTNINKVREGIGMVFQRFNLFPHLMVKGNITLTLTELKPMGKEEAGRKVLELPTRVELTDRTKVYPGQLSGGQKQRATVAQSLAMNPGIMPLDESTSTPDPEMVGKALGVMKQLIADGMTMVAVTHGMGFAREVADRVVLMDKGYIVREGIPDEVFGDPREERTRNFLDEVLQTLGFLGGQAQRNEVWINVINNNKLPGHGKSSDLLSFRKDKRLRGNKKSPAHARLWKQMTGVEPASPAWEVGVLPMNYICTALTLYHVFWRTQAYLLILVKLIITSVGLIRPLPGSQEGIRPDTGISYGRNLPKQSEYGLTL